MCTLSLSGTSTLSLRLVFSLDSCGIKNGSEIVVYMYVSDLMHSNWKRLQTVYTLFRNV